MKKIIWLIMFLSSLGVYAQKASNITIDTSYHSSPFSVYIKNKTDTINRIVVGSYSSGQNDRFPTYSQMRTYVAASAPPVSGTITSSPTIGQTFASLNGFIALFSQTNNPTGNLTGGTNLQRSATAYTHNLAYQYGRTNLNTNPIASAVVNPGSFNVFTSSPAQGSSNSGNQSVTTPANTNRTYTITITTTDSKTASISTTDSWFGNAYYGYAATTAATSTEVLAHAGGSMPLAAAHNGTWTVFASGSNYPFIAIPATMGTITIFTLTNGTDITTLFASATVSITNTSGYVENYNVYTMNTAQSGNLTFVTN